MKRYVVLFSLKGMDLAGHAATVVHFLVPLYANIHVVSTLIFDE